MSSVPKWQARTSALEGIDAMPDDTILCWTSPFDSSRHVTVADYHAWVAEGEQGKSKIADLFWQRLSERYVQPMQRLEMIEKNGFAVMALSCLSIEAFETFYQGWPSSKDKSKAAFLSFFAREPRFIALRSHAEDFYNCVRCGILHQGETAKGWTIRLLGPLFDGANLRINADCFQKTLLETISDYRDSLKREPLTADVWRNFRTKMNATIKNCEP
jgi:hypothetical protein